MTRFATPFTTALAAAMLLSGCVTPERGTPGANTPKPGAPVPAPAAPIAPAEISRPPVTEHHLGAATRSLVAQARALTDRGDLVGASVTLDRALRIEPSNPLLWLERGRLRLAENDAHQAEGCARKALALASGDRQTQAQSGRLLVQALRAQHRDQEAAEIERQSYMR